MQNLLNRHPLHGVLNKKSLEHSLMFNESFSIRFFTLHFEMCALRISQSEYTVLHKSSSKE